MPLESEVSIEYILQPCEWTNAMPRASINNSDLMLIRASNRIHATKKHTHSIRWKIQKKFKEKRDDVHKQPVMPFGYEYVFCMNAPSS